MDGSESHNYDSDTCAEAELPDSPKVESGVDEQSNDGHLIKLEKNKSSGSFPFSTEEGSSLRCDSCAESNISKLAAKLCIECTENFCDECSSVHCSQKATRNHVLNDCMSPTKAPRAVFLCSTCSVMQHTNPATMSCKECEEVYCDICSNVHRTQKATRTHTLSVHEDLPGKTMCEPCEYNGKENIEAVYLCIDCDEVQCTDCKSVHIKQKVTRGHTLILSFPDTDKLCDVCWKLGQQATPVKYCKVCFTKMCNKCAKEHREDSSASEHKLYDIKPQASIKPVSTQVVQHTSNKQTVPEERPKVKKSVIDTTKPGKPCVVGQVSVDTVCLVWESPTQLFENPNFQLRYKEADGSSKWRFYPDLAPSSTITLTNLKSDTHYVFQVRMVNDENEGSYSDISDTIGTIQSAAHHVMDFMYDVTAQDVNIPLKKIPFQENIKTRNEKAKTRKLIIGNACKTHSRERTIMLVGATGTGKSTLVDGMVNYILGVNWNDPYRLTLIDLVDEEKDKDADQAVSQTQWITCYTLNPIKGSRLNYSLNIIDTPGFGDTRGIDRDKQIIEQIRTLFSSEDETGILNIDAVCFLIKAPDARLTPTQMYIFNAIMSLFGQDIENNFCMLVTFADGKRPPVLAALKAAKLPHEQYFPFNNSGLFAENTGENVPSFSSMFWDMGCKSFQMFFDKLTKMETKSLRQTRDVLEQREVIEITMENLLPKLDAGLLKLEEMRVKSGYWKSTRHKLRKTVTLLTLYLKQNSGK
ncbi:uncharacterized protein LOC132745005 [Ruditapes philippinarum]|uniref:uncharacterized protein LOC132745005 n=1 Tax=Ruditapes philippinarum TaxID=129788 RepID=UPI00295ACD61|nr:uncharacterized protein LOC132745005 [Ruditapes philippinarum]